MRAHQTQNIETAVTIKTTTIIIKEQYDQMWLCIIFQFLFTTLSIHFIERRFDFHAIDIFAILAFLFTEKYGHEYTEIRK